MKLGDKVKVVKGSYKDCIGTIVGISFSFGKKIVTVEPNEPPADDRQFWESDLKVIGRINPEAK